MHLALQNALQLLQAPQGGLKPCADAHGIRHVFDQADIAAPTVEGLAVVETAHIAGNALVLVYDLSQPRNTSRLTNLPSVVRWLAVAVALQTKRAMSGNQHTGDLSRGDALSMEPLVLIE